MFVKEKRKQGDREDLDDSRVAGVDGGLKSGDGLRDSLRVLIAPQVEWDFAALVEKAQIIEDVKRTERLNQERERGRNKRDSKPSNKDQRLREGLEWMGRTGSEASLGRGNAQPPRGGQQPPRGHGQAKGGNDLGRGAPGRGSDHIEARQLALVYAAHHQEDKDAPDANTMVVCSRSFWEVMGSSPGFHKILAFKDKTPIFGGFLECLNWWTRGNLGEIRGGDQGVRERELVAENSIVHRVREFVRILRTIGIFLSSLVLSSAAKSVSAATGATIRAQLRLLWAKAQVPSLL
ncbi:Fibrous sheath-interacting 2 [Gossypium arboreum]|uniref:Fibrous sheath-interacting 2 n=1 Tax=Gossypium arboreum TaxID=29729 RepID=A0A0B0P9V3_GOSAR|nr:Fibrous sheath-interacting 2 [Gossypium arboreum]